METRRIAYIGVLTSMALILSYFERMLPPPVPIAGVKFGLANIVILVSLYILSNKDAFAIMLIKVFCVGFFFSGVVTSIFFSLLGGLLSFISMLLFKKTKLFSIVGVSMIGGVMFNVGQIIASYFFVSNISIFYYLPVLLFFGLTSGFLTGIIGHYTITSLKNNIS